MKKVILTGDRPTGPLHIGHLFGSLLNRVKLQEKYESYIMIADIQALTDNFARPDKVRENVFEVALDNLAVGLDPKISNIFIQSLVPEIAELNVFYSNLVSLNRLQRNPTVKEELKQKEELFKGGVSYGFLGYPISQAADITIFEADLVPVGEDQLPMIEQARELVKKFNKLYGPTLKLPEALLSSNPRIKGLDGGSKMGKSLNNAIYLSDSPETIKKKVKKALTDSKKIHLNDPGNPDLCTVFYYHQLFKSSHLKEIDLECRQGQRGCLQCKEELSQNIINFLKPIQEKRKYYQDRPDLVKEILLTGTKKAQARAQTTMKKIKTAMKLDYF